MASSVLVAYATRSGCTREVAEAVAATLREHHLEVNIQLHDVEAEWEGGRGQLEKALAKFPWFKLVDIGPPVASKIPTGLRPWPVLRKSAFILRAACPQTPCKDGIYPRSYERGPLPYFDRQELAARNPIWQNVSSTT
jgi:hypothetical protein